MKGFARSVIYKPVFDRGGDADTACFVSSTSDNLDEDDSESMWWILPEES